MSKNKNELFFQGDVLIERVADVKDASKLTAIPSDPDGSVVLARGEVTGHRHRFAEQCGVAMFRDDGLARDIPTELYIGHVKVGDAGADLVHEEHDTISLDKGTYRIRRQREWTAEQARIVAD